MSKSDKRNKAKNNEFSKQTNTESQSNNHYQSSKSSDEVSGYFSAKKRDSISQELAEDESEAFDFIEVFYRYGQIQQTSQLKLNGSQLNIENE